MTSRTMLNREKNVHAAGRQMLREDAIVERALTFYSETSNQTIKIFRRMADGSTSMSAVALELHNSWRRGRPTPSIHKNGPDA